jgi:hypothetical protein
MSWTDFIKNLTIKDILAFIGAATIVLGFIEALFRTIPRLGKLRTAFWGFLARKWKHKRLEKKAIAGDIENTVNEMVLELQSELPSGWLNRASIEWVDRDIKDSDFIDGEMILRIRPFADQDTNLINGIYFFFSKALFPETKEIIPANVRKATALQISRRTINSKKSFLRGRFEKSILEPSVKEDSSILEYIEKFDGLDRKGFFTGGFLREIHEIATRSRFKELRNKMEEEVKSVLAHIVDFVNNIPKRNNPDWRWSRKGPATSYAFLLVAQPYHGGVGRYVNKAKKHFQEGVDRIYIMGAKQEKNFVKKVISAVAGLPESRLAELFALNRDYRGELSGIGALFVKGGYDKDVEEEIETFFESEKTTQGV